MFLVDQFDVGGRLQYVGADRLAGNPGGHPCGLVSMLRAGPAQAVEVEMRHLNAHIDSWVVSAAGQDDDGSQWMVLIQQGPKGSSDALTFARNRAIRLAGGVLLTDEVLVSRRQVNQYFRDEILLAADGDIDVSTVLDLGYVKDVPFHVLLQGFDAELTGYQARDLLVRSAYGCAFPDSLHECTGEVVTDVFAQWSRQGS